MNAYLSLHVSNVRVDVSIDDAAAHGALSAVWEHAKAVIPPTRAASATVSRSGDAGEVRLANRTLHCHGDDLAPTFELLLYDALPGWHPAPRMLLHAAAVAFDEVTVVLVGPSGSGKSSLALALLEHGGRYLTDELVVLDGPQLWGLTRAPQFEPGPADARLPAWLGAVDRAAYRYRSVQDQSVVLPLARLRPDQIGRGTFDVARARLFLPRVTGRTALEPARDVDALAMLLQELRTPPRVDLGPLLAPGATAISWSDPHEAARLVLRSL